MNVGDVTGPRWVSGEGDLSARLAEAEAERDALQAQLDNMTTEWGVGLGDMFMNRYETRENAEFVVDCRGDMDFRLMKRSVGPWVEVTD